MFDFGSGPGTGNFLLARQGNGNDLIFLSNVGGGFDSPVVARDVIRPGVRAALHAQRAAAPQDLARALAALDAAQRAAIEDATTRVD